MTCDQTNRPTDSAARRLRPAALGVLLVVVASFASPGCGAGSRSPYLSQEQTPRNPLKAQRLHQRATAALERDEVDAERLLREALAADIYHGPSHNNLGILYLRRGMLYEAATEFEWARKLMPGHPGPRVNLALALERAGRTDEALDAYDAALAVYDGFLPAVQGKARLLVSSGRADARSAGLLRDIALRGDEAWRQWARMELVKLER